MSNSPQSQTPAPVDPAIPPVDPVDPAIPPVDPEIASVDPVDPAIPPVDPEIASVGPAIPPVDPEIASVDAEIAHLPGRFADRIGLIAIEAIREKHKDQSSAVPLVDELLESLKGEVTSHQPTRLDTLASSVLFALHICTCPSEDQPAVPIMGEHSADSVNDTLLLAILVIILFESSSGCRTPCAFDQDNSSASVTITAPCPASLRPFLPELEGQQRIGVIHELGSSTTRIFIPLTPP